MFVKNSLYLLHLPTKGSNAPAPATPKREDVLLECLISLRHIHVQSLNSPFLSYR